MPTKLSQGPLGVLRDSMVWANMADMDQGRRLRKIDLPVREVVECYSCVDGFSGG